MSGVIDWIDYDSDSDPNGGTKELEEVLTVLWPEYVRAVNKHPLWEREGYSVVEQVSLMAEEMLELVQAANDIGLHGSWRSASREERDHLIQEALHVAIVALRMVHNRMKERDI